MNRRQVLVTGAACLGGSHAIADPVLYVPPEEAPHERTLMMWPSSLTVHPDRAFLDDLQDTIARIASAIAAFEPVALRAARDPHAGIASRVARGVALWDIPTDDLWARDAGPLIARAGGRRVVSHIRFNGWGGKQTHRQDGQIAARVAARLDHPLIDIGLVGEPGGVDHDGHGLLIAHESSWRIANRNPGLSLDQISRRLLKAYGADRLLWSPGLRGQDISDYHIDSLARLTGPNRVLMSFLRDRPDRRDPFHMAALQTHDRLDAAGVSVDVIPEPQIRRVRSPDFVASYVNFYVCNGAVIAPQFGDRDTDAVAVDALARHYPGREIIVLNVDPLGEVGGGIHCATQQVPR